MSAQDLQDIPGLLRAELRNFQPSKPLSEFEKGYLAGLIDGEGCITIAKYRKRSLLKSGSPSYVVQVLLSISNTNPEILHRARAIIGEGSVKLYRESVGNRKDSYMLTLTPSAQRRLLPQLLSCLVGKRRQAALALEMLQLQTEGRRTLANRSKQYKEQTEALRKQIQLLNRRGPR